MMLVAFAGQTVDTIVTNAVLKTHVNLDKKRPYTKTFVVTSNGTGTASGTNNNNNSDGANDDQVSFKTSLLGSINSDDYDDKMAALGIDAWSRHSGTGCVTDGAGRQRLPENCTSHHGLECRASPLSDSSAWRYQSRVGADNDGERYDDSDSSTVGRQGINGCLSSDRKCSVTERGGEPDSCRDLLLQVHTDEHCGPEVEEHDDRLVAAVEETFKSTNTQFVRIIENLLSNYRESACPHDDDVMSTSAKQQLQVVSLPRPVSIESDCTKQEEVIKSIVVAASAMLEHCRQNIEMDCLSLTDHNSASDSRVMREMTALGRDLLDGVVSTEKAMVINSLALCLSYTLVERAMSNVTCESRDPSIALCVRSCIMNVAETVNELMASAQECVELLLMKMAIRENFINAGLDRDEVCPRYSLCGNNGSDVCCHDNQQVCVFTVLLSFEYWPTNLLIK